MFVKVNTFLGDQEIYVACEHVKIVYQGSVPDETVIRFLAGDNTPLRVKGKASDIARLIQDPWSFANQGENHISSLADAAESDLKKDGV